MGKFIDITGQRFNHWTVLERDPQKYRDEVHWICKCDCGTIRSVGSFRLRNGTSKSCGCIKQEVAAKVGASKIKNLVGQRFGKLRVLKLAGKDSGNHYQYLCICDCGKEKIIRASSLTSGNTKSCGECSHASFGEVTIKQLLETNGIYFEYQKTFIDAKYQDTQRPIRFDFYVDNRYIIEFDGKQHFEITGGWNTQENFERTQKHDSIKERWCKEHGIPLIHIPYTNLKTLTFEDIWLPDNKNTSS